MSISKRRSFTVVEIESMEVINQKKNSMNRALRIINSQQTKTGFILIVYYNIIKQVINYIHLLTFLKITINDIYYKKFHIDQTKFFYNDRGFYYKKTLNLYMYDNGIIINNIYISYEYIISFGIFDTDGYIVKIRVFANLTNINGRLQLELTNGIVDILFLCDDGFKICTLLKKNMYYHIKYNKLNDDVINYYNIYYENKKLKKLEYKKIEEDKIEDKNLEDKIEEEKLEEEKLEERIINNEN